jgi:hypothetical protein
VTLTGIQRLKIDDILGTCARTRGKVERRVVQDLRERIFPAVEKEAAASPDGTPGMYQTAVIQSMPTVELAGAEAVALLGVLEEFERAQGVPANDGEWFDGMVDRLKEVK